MRLGQGGGPQVSKFEQIRGQGLGLGQECHVTYYPSVNRQNDTAENIAFPQTTYASGSKGFLIDFSLVLHGFKNFTNATKDNTLLRVCVTNHHLVFNLEVKFSHD